MEDGMKALVLVDAPDHVCCRYRIRAFEPALNAVGWSLTIEALASGPIARAGQLRRSSRYDAVILQRKLLSAWDLLTLRRSARRLVFDFDDAVLYRDSYDPRGPHSKRRAARFARLVRAADVVLAGNEFLARCARDAGASPGSVRFQPTCVDLTKFLSPKLASSASGAELVWIGSSSTLQGLERVRAMLERLGREIPGLSLRLICDRHVEFGPLETVHVPWSEQSEAHDLAAADIGISWIPDDLWSRGKCGLKVLQYQAASLPVVANPVGVHPAMVERGENGFLAETSDEWVECIRTLVADPDLRARLGRQALADVTANYSVAAWSAAFVEALGTNRDTRPFTHAPHGNSLKDALRHSPLESAPRRE
jgi:glycosyltransferase involved in cell wall biosynthesis